MRCFFSCFCFLPESPITGPETRLRACSPVAPTMTLARGRPELLREVDALRPGPAPQPSHQLSSCSIRASWGGGEREVGVGGNRMQGDRGGRPSVALIPGASRLPGAYLGLLSPPPRSQALVRCQGSPPAERKGLSRHILWAPLCPCDPQNLGNLQPAPPCQLTHLGLSSPRRPQACPPMASPRLQLLHVTPLLRPSRAPRALGINP